MSTWFRIQSLKIPLDKVFVDNEVASIRACFEKHLGASIQDFRPVKKALDARHQKLSYMYTADILVDSARGASWEKSGKFPLSKQTVEHHYTLKPQSQKRPVVIGAGPAGLFAAYTLARAGAKPILLERGSAVEKRSKDVSQLYAHGVLNPESNVCFGEGGAGTYSDGKLYTRVGDRRVDQVLNTMVGLGAKSSITWDHRPHLGTDKLINLLKKIREALVAMGTDIRFNTRVDGFLSQNGHITALKLQGGETLKTDRVVCATGHSAENIWHQLQSAGAALESRPFAVGFRVEHPQDFIDDARYGAARDQYPLPAAYYSLRHNQKTGERRGVYSFCMCPGGVVVPTPTREGELCINGMSHAARSGRFANSALVVTIKPEDFGRWGFDGVYAGVQFQRTMEQKSYAMGGGKFVAPSSRLSDFINKKVSNTYDSTTYRRGLSSQNLWELYPPEISEALCEGIQQFDKNIRGFVQSDAKLIGVETRTASPVRVLRDEHHQSVGLKGLFPAGEGMGFGGGIVSAAVDGIRCAESLLESLGATLHTESFLRPSAL